MTGIEPVASGTTNQRSNRLSYKHHVRARHAVGTIIHHIGGRSKLMRVSCHGAIMGRVRVPPAVRVLRADQTLHPRRG